MTAAIATFGRVVAIIVALGLAWIAVRAIALDQPVPFVMGALLMGCAIVVALHRDDA